MAKSLTTTKPRGGARPGAGRPVADIQLDKESARSLKVLILARGLDYTREQCDKLVRELIEAEYRKYDERHQRDAEEWTGEIL